MTDATSTQIQLAARPVGWPTHDDFHVAQVTYGAPQPGEVRVRNEFVSVDPYMRGRMNDTRSYVAPYALGETITCGAVGRVVASASDDLPVGTVVLHQHGWADIVQADAATFRAIPEIPGVPLSLNLHILGMTGLTAYHQNEDVIRAKRAMMHSAEKTAFLSDHTKFSRNALTKFCDLDQFDHVFVDRNIAESEKAFLLENDVNITLV